MLADFSPKGQVADKYGVYLRKEGEAARALFVLDGRGTIRWSYLSPIGVSPGADGISKALDQMENNNRARKGLSKRENRYESEVRYYVGRRKPRKVTGVTRPEVRQPLRPAGAERKRQGRVLERGSAPR